MTDYGGTFEKDFFPDTKIEHLELNILDDMWQELRAEIEANSWPVDEGLRFILAAGLYAIKTERRNEQTKSLSESDLKAELDRIQRERMQIEGRYAVMKFRTYQFLQDAKTLATKLNVWQTEVENLRKANELLRKQIGEKR
jgi:hypothetical protein